MAPERQPGHEALYVAVGRLRELLVGLLSHSLGTGATEGACLHAAYLVRESLPILVPGASVAVKGGAGGKAGGCRDSAGLVRGHYWNQVTLPDHTTWLVDVTADQFGLPPTICEPLDRSQHTHRPGDQVLVDAHVAELAASLPGAART